MLLKKISLGGLLLVMMETAWSVLPPPSPVTDYVTIPSDPSFAVKDGISMAIATNQIPMVTFIKNGKLMLAVCNNEQCTSPTNVEIAAITSQVQVSMAINQLGFAVVAYGNGTTEHLKLVICSDLLCSAPVRKEFGHFPEYFSLAVKKNGVPFISFSYVESDFKSGLSLMVCANPACSQSTIVSLVNSGSNGHSGGYNDIAFKSDGFPVISFLDDSGTRLMIAICANNDCSSRTIKAIDDFSDETGWYTAIATDESGQIFISYVDMSRNVVRLAICNNPLCTLTSYATVDDYTFSQFFHTDVQVGKDGFPLLSYWNFDEGKLSIAKCDNLNCFAPQITSIARNTQGRNSLALNANGDPVIAYAANAKVILATCKLCFLPEVKTLTPINEEVIDTSLMLNREGVPFMSYYDAASNILKLLVCDDVNCRTSSSHEVLASAGLNSSLSFTASGFPAIAISGNNDIGLRLALCNSNTCDSPKLVTIENSIRGFNNDLKFNRGIPYISYHSGLGSHDLKLAFCSNPECDGDITRLVLDGNNIDVGRYSSLAFTTSGAPVISYLDETNDALKLVICSDSVCSGTRVLPLVDHTDKTGLFTSLALTSSNRPVISFYDETNGDLKLLECLDPNCEGLPQSTLDTEGDLGLLTSLALTDDDLPVIAYYDKTRKIYKLAICSVTDCSEGAENITIISFNETATGIRAIVPSLTLGKHGYPRVAYSINEVLKIAIFRETGALFVDGFE